MSLFHPITAEHLFAMLATGRGFDVAAHAGGLLRIMPVDGSPAMMTTQAEYTRLDQLIDAHHKAKGRK